MRLVAGATKVVERGSGDGVYITTTATVGCPTAAGWRRDRPPGDRVLVSGDVGRHEPRCSWPGELHFEASLASDCALLQTTCEAVFAAGGDGVRCLRDATRGGLATVICEWAKAAGRDIALRESAIPVHESVAAVCELLGLDPYYLACEGRLVAIVDERVANAVEGALQDCHPTAAIIGEVAAGEGGRVVLETGVGGRRVLDLLTGGQLPRIC